MLREARAVLFDLDDTLIELAVHQAWAWSEACRFAAEERPGLDPVRLGELVRQSADPYYESAAGRRHVLRDPEGARTAVLRRCLSRIDAEYDSEALALSVAGRYCELRDSRVALVAGAVDLLNALRSGGAVLALVTNGPARGQRSKIERFNLAQYFRVIQIEGEFGAGKPEEAVYHAALGALGMDASDATFIGDNLEWDVGAPLRLGMQAVWVDVAGSGLPGEHAARPRRIIRSIAELHDEL